MGIPDIKMHYFIAFVMIGNVMSVMSSHSLPRVKMWNSLIIKTFCLLFSGPSSILSNMKRKREEDDDYDKPWMLKERNHGLPFKIIVNALWASFVQENTKENGQFSANLSCLWRGYMYAIHNGYSLHQLSLFRNWILMGVQRCCIRLSREKTIYLCT